MGENVALIVGAGEGKRFGGDLPKQYRVLSGITILRRSLDIFIKHPQITAVHTVIHSGHHEFYKNITQGLSLPEPINGGNSRQASVLLGLENLVDTAPSKVLIHDAARPLLDKEIISRVLKALDNSPGAVPVLAVADTLKRGNGKFIDATINRKGLWRAQTPQGFRYENILAAHRQVLGEDLTDDAAVAERAGLEVAMVEGSEKNFKVTEKEDLKRAENILSAKGVRTGLGFDVHRFTDGNKITLCGVVIPHSYSLLGHSDADVGLHAVTDAILGAIGNGDIGSHFPPTDEQWKEASSDIFLNHARKLLAELCGHISNLDVTLICEEPKIGPYRQAMQKRISEILEISEFRVSVKATTTEGLGFTGRGEGIAAQAIATIVI
jgi:2-C-methyl-D-erythritol 4-phosphate cytidylyltransferase/2-C-methyl-D-erythritol 2,4-cyclodiphosphate synthase